MEFKHTGHHGRQSSWELRIADVGLARLAVHSESMDFSVKRIPHLPDISREFDSRASGPDLDLLESLTRQPVGDRLDVRVGRPELLAKLVRSEPFMEIGGVLAQLLVHQFAERGLLFGAALEDEHHPLHRSGIAYESLIELRTRERMDVAFEADELRFVNGLSDTGGDGRGLSGGCAIGLGLCGGAKGRERQKKSKGKERTANC